MLLVVRFANTEKLPLLSNDQIICNDYGYAGNNFRSITLVDTPDFDRKDEQADAIYTKYLEEVIKSTTNSILAIK